MSGTRTWKKIHARLGVVSSRVNVQMAEGVHMPRLHVRPKKAMVLWKQETYYCLWFEAGVLLD